jgi:carboxyl-terminal processing protease
VPAEVAAVGNVDPPKGILPGKDKTMKALARCAGLLALIGWSMSGQGQVACAAESQETVGQPYVVLVGVSHYPDKQILPRPTAEADAQALYDLFRNKDYLGVDADHVKLLLGQQDPQRPSQPATRANILRALEWVAQKARKNDLVIIGMFLQGAPLGERVCYFALDSTFRHRDKDALASGDIEHALQKLKSEHFVAFLDVYFKGFDSGKEPAPDLIMTNFYREFLGNVDEEKGPLSSRVLFLANAGLRPSLTTNGHGAFAQVVLEGLQGKADTQGYEPDGLVTVEELAKYVRQELPALSRRLGQSEEDKGQTPVVLEGQSSNFVLTYNPAVLPQVRARLERFHKLAAAQQLPAALVEEGQHLLSRMPRLVAKQELRKAYQKLADGQLSLTAFQKERQAILARLQLSDRDAAYYARMVLRAADLVKAGYVQDVNQGQLIDWGIRGLYKHLGEKLPSDLRQRLAQVKELSKNDLLRLLTDARKHLGKREDLDNGNDITYTLHPMLEKLDRHTDYIDPETLRRMEVEIRGHFSGIGVQIRRNTSKDALQVVTPIKDSPAYKAGIYAGDLITYIIREVDDRGRPLPKPEKLSTKGMSTEEAVKKILGKAGTKIKLIIQREGSEKPLEFELIRGRVEVETVLGYKRNPDDSWDYVIDPANRICYVRLTQFSSNTYRDLYRLMERLTHEGGIKGFILDLRFNPGGLLDSAVKIADLFIDDGVIVTIRPRNGPETSYIGKSDGSYLEFPMVCLVNGYSASASEIVSACLQDHQRAIILGTRTYGKGSVQTILEFDTTAGRGKIKLTTATFWRPSKKNLNKASTPGREEDEWGVTPDPGFVVKLSTKELNDLQDHLRETEIIPRPDRRQPATSSKSAFRDRQLELALEYLRGQIRLAAQRQTSSKGGE